MKSINIRLKIINVDAPYEYIGEAKEYNDIIEFDDNDTNYIFDKTIKRLTKSNRNNTLIIDFQNKKIIIKDKENEIDTNINLLKEEINSKKIHYIYKLDSNKIEFILEKEV